jgi:hypothetical protein
LGLDSLFNTVLRTIKDWDPQAEYSTENKYRDELLVVLRKKLNRSGSDAYSSPIWGIDYLGQHFIKKEAGRSLADIGIDDEIAIELKLNLKRRSQINRLVGQVVDYLRGYSSVIIVLCGHTEQEAVDVLKYNLKRIIGSSSAFGQEKLVRIVSKERPRKPRKVKKRLALL